jgi:hypothetical protein
MTRNDIVTRADGTQIELSAVGQDIVFENEHVRVWEISLEPGERQPWHRHDNPYLVIAIEAADNRIDPIDGDAQFQHEPVGGVIYREAGETHMLTNSGETRYRSRLIELKCVGENGECRRREEPA